MTPPPPFPRTITLEVKSPFNPLLLCPSFCELIRWGSDLKARWGRLFMAHGTTAVYSGLLAPFGARALELERAAILEQEPAG